MQARRLQVDGRAQSPDKESSSKLTKMIGTHERLEVGGIRGEGLMGRESGGLGGGGLPRI
jgi:hypothetical protein